MRLLDVRRDEVAKVAITWAMVALFSLGFTVGWSAVHTMLVKRLGVEALPYAYVGISLLGVAGASACLALADAMRRDRLLILLALATGAVLAGARWLVPATPGGEAGADGALLVFFALVFVAKGVGSSVLGTQIWTTINDLFRPSQGRRIYPILGTAGTVGGIVGGASIQWLAEGVGTANLVLVWAACLAGQVPLAMLLRMRFGAELRGRRPGASGADEGQPLREGWAFLRSSPMTTTLGFVAVAFWVVGALLDFQYTRILNATFTAESDLVAYYGLYTIVINASGLVAQAFIGGHLIRHVGVARGLLALPATVLAGLAAIATTFTFWPGVLARYAWEMVGMTVQGNAWQLALNAVPADLRARVRGFFEGVLNPLGGVLGGLVILALNHAPPAFAGQGWADPVTCAGLVLALAWFGIVWRGRAHYLDLIATNLGSADRRTALDAIDCLAEPGSVRARTLLREVARSNDPARRIAAVRVWGQVGAAEAFAGLAEACEDSDERVRLEALRAMVRAAGRRPVPAVAIIAAERRMAADASPAVRAAALQALVHRADPPRLQALKERWLDDALPEVRARVVDALGAAGMRFRSVLLTQLRDSSAVVRAAAVGALWQFEELRVQSRSALARLTAVDGVTDSASSAAVLRAFHRTGERPDSAALARLASFPDPVVEVLAAALRLRDEQDAAATDRSLGVILAVLAAPEHAERIQRELLPWLPDVPESVADSILIAASTLPTAQRTRVASALGEWHRVLEARLHAESPL